MFTKKRYKKETREESIRKMAEIMGENNERSDY